MIIGITGSYRAGKGTVAEYLVSQKDFKHYSVSGYIAEFFKNKEKREPVSRDELINTGNEIRTNLGADYIVKELFKRAQMEDKNAIIESIRCPAEALFIKNQTDSYLFAVDADPQIRYDRTVKAGGIKAKVTFDEFIASEQKEFHSTNPNEQNIGRCIEMADFKIINNSTQENLYEEIENRIIRPQGIDKERK